ncbi:bi-domain-containing oxidoreductase [Algoriphagus sediminis]|uniref:Bi-domain-containing oxidoreductase n=1 Tax=Algoriphagus sediminis TaxID=3057113 RepID=A0ABT7YDS0_9BACT|nr:bi-domain-containing oxidoreductase [Algoriphagus sediminis]MDN3204669.1 bi-domain-containing oxidoreductase [Algoriphagus sediminis]
MQQLTQKLGSGEMEVQEVPMPMVGKGMILVRNHYSIISAGTEKSTVSAARKSLIGKAKERPQQVLQVLDVLKKQGPIQTYRAVKKKLDAYSPLGYSCAGEVLESGEGVTDIKKGDFVACAGIGYANHAEVVAVPNNLCVKLPEGVSLKDAAYNTLGAIALQGIRQADLRLGESCAVIGLGLLGQLASLMLRASGVRVVGIDIAEGTLKLARDNGAADLTLQRDTAGIEEKIRDFTGGIGVDSVIIAAATKSSDPINFAGSICKKKGSVIILGAVPTGFDRDPYWYMKELELKMACSYGPGRYDLNYEEKGIDYPAAYVRWTERRNMQAFQVLLSTKAIDIGYLTTHEFDFSDAAKAYDLIMNRTEPFIGVALKYDVEKPQKTEAVSINKFNKSSKVNLSFIGAGSYAQGNLLPNIPKVDWINRVGVLTNTGTTSKRVAEKFDFEFCTPNEQDVLNKKTNSVFIATRHDSHAKYVMVALRADKHVFVEKPVCLTLEELEEIKEIYEAKDRSLMVGFNRRFSPLTQKVKQKFGDGPMSMIYRINSGVIPKDTWIQDMEIGGGRIIGEVCHFIDLLTYINGSLPIKVAAAAVPDHHGHNDTVNILLTFANGSTGVVAYYANGAKDLPKEYIEIFASGSSAIINDFKELKIYGKGNTVKKKLLNQDKGQKGMVESFFNGLKSEGRTPISFEEIYAVSKATIHVLTSLKNGGQQVEV